MMIKKNNNGFTLIEVMITIVILFIGILAMALMQIQAIKGNSTAFSRSSANAIALAFLEEFRRLPFGDASLNTGADLDAGRAPAGGSPTPANADNQYNPANLPALASMFTVSGTNIVDGFGNSFQIFWNVLPQNVQVGTTTYTPYVTIRLFMYWDSSFGKNSLIMTTVKRNNS